VRRACKAHFRRQDALIRRAPAACSIQCRGRSLTSIRASCTSVAHQRARKRRACRGQPIGMPAAQVRRHSPAQPRASRYCRPARVAAAPWLASEGPIEQSHHRAPRRALPSTRMLVQAGLGYATRRRLRSTVIQVVALLGQQGIDPLQDHVSRGAAAAPSAKSPRLGDWDSGGHLCSSRPANPDLVCGWFR